MLIPERRLLWFVGAWTLAGATLVVAPAARNIVLGVAAVAALVAVVDAWRARRALDDVEVRRVAPRALSVGLWHPVTLQIQAATRPVSGRVVDNVPAGAEAEHDEQPFRAGPNTIVHIGYRMRPLERGHFRFGPVTIRAQSPLGLWNLQRQWPDLAADVRVYPDFARIVRYTWLATDNRLSQLGVLQRRRRGEGLEFHQLRDYRQDDPPRQIDWNATSRARKLISREYQDERDQQIVLVLDCGQRMRTRDGDMSHFDHALNALLLLAYVALRQGDAVGVATFAHDRPRFIAPRKSLATMSMLMQRVFDLQPTTRTPDFIEAATSLGRRLTKRALVVVATSVRDEDSEGVRQASQYLGRRHAVVVAHLREPALTQARDAPVQSLDDALVYAAATDYIERQRRTLGALARAGVHVIDTTADALARQLVNRYWALKRSGI